MEKAIEILSVTTKAAALPLVKLIKSAIQSAKNTYSIDEKTLFIKEFRVDAGATLKRSMPRARGSAFPILKRTCHVSLVLDERQTVDNNQSTVKSNKKMQSKPLSVVGSKS